MSKLLVENRAMVFPGDVIAEGNNFEIATPYLKRIGNRVVATVIGLVTIEKDDRTTKLGLIPLEGCYYPKVGDLVIGIVIDIGVTSWLVDIRAPFPAVLNASDYLGKPYNPSEELSKYLNIGDVILAKIAQFDRGRDPLLTVQEKGLGKVVEGVLIEIKPSRVPRVVGRRKSMLSMLQEETRCQIVVGNNGRILLRCPDPEREAIAILAIKKIEREAHTQGLTERIKEFIIEQKIKRGLIGSGGGKGET
ncbi:MAG: RNA-binding protein [Thermoprotei archaeon]|nr:MAG: RNA-binding protein [Thermoprotei archaeon]